MRACTRVIACACARVHVCTQVWHAKLDKFGGRSSIGGNVCVALHETREDLENDFERFLEILVLAVQR